MKIINQQSYDNKANGVLSNKTSIPWYLGKKGIKDTVSFSANKSENRIPESLEQVDINPKADNESCEIKENPDGSRAKILKKTHKMSISNKEVDMPVEMTIVKEDASGKRTEALTVKRSEKFPYEYDIYSYSPNEKPRKISEAIKTENGSMITQTFTSEDGEKQITSIKKTENNKTESKYKTKIKEEGQKEIKEVERTFEKIDENHTKSTVAGVEFETTFLPDKIVVKKTSPVRPEPKTIELDFEQLDPDLMDLYKQLPGDYFFKLKTLGTKVKLGFHAEQNNGCYEDDINTISMSEELKNNPYAFAHELGHAMDYKERHFYRDNNFTKPFRDEYEVFNNNATDTEKEVIDYFTGPNASLQKLMLEVAAETFALPSGLKNDSEIYMLRDVILQKYFPKSVAYIVNSHNIYDMFM